MKLKRFGLVFTAAILICMAAIIFLLTREDGGLVDTAFYNRQMKSVEALLMQGGSREQAQERYSCRILFQADPDYEILLNESIREGGLVLDYEDDGNRMGKVIWRTEANRYREQKRDLLAVLMIMCVLILMTGNGLLLAFHYRCIRPFRELERFADQVAKGNLDLPLPMHKQNAFGAFTESFDLMREELKEAREQEYRANVSKKELTAGLSHDIKTPVAAIKAACEVLQLKEKNPDTLEKVDVIGRKAEQIDRLMENMFHAALDELEVLKVEVKVQSSGCIPEMFQGMEYYGEIRLEQKVPECLVYMDRLRLQQVIDNALNNSYKYAKTAVSVSFRDLGEDIVIQIRDFGPGVPEEELALVAEKFYRGGNAVGKSGSGLGLYLASKFMAQMNGGLECFCQDGFVTRLFLKKV